MTRLTTTALLAAVLLLAVPATAAPTELPPLYTTADGYAASNDNFGGNITGMWLNPANLEVRRADPAEWRTALEFDISDLPPAGQRIVSAKLIIYITASNNMIGVYGRTGDGDITDEDFMLVLPPKITEFDPDSSPEGLRNEVDVTGFIQTQAATPGPHVLLQLIELHNNERNTFAGSSYWQTEHRPHLLVTTDLIPEPACLLLIAAGAGVMLRRRRR